MSDSTDESSAESSELHAGCPLSASLQIRNLLLYACSIALYYLAAPVLYVGVLQAGLFKDLKADDSLANLPASVYLWMAPVPVFVAWLCPQVRLLRPMLLLAYLTMATAGGAVAATLMWGSRSAVIVAVVVHAGILGGANGVVQTFLWELLARGVSDKRRGWTLGLAFGFGPICAVVGSSLAQLLLSGKAYGFTISPLAYPAKFAVLFAATVPIMIVAALLAAAFVVPLPVQDVRRQPFLTGIFGGLGQFAGNRLILIAVVSYLLVYAGGNSIQQNVSLYAKEIFGESASQYTGYQLVLRFGFKIFAGFGLGWLLTRAHPKAGLLATAGLCLTGVLWAWGVPGKYYLVSFGLLGAGELFGVYYPNYVVCCSPRSQTRRNMAYTSMCTVLVGFAPVFYGTFSDQFGLRGSFLVAAAILVLTMLLVQFGLPARPAPRFEDLDASDLDPALTKS